MTSNGLRNYLLIIGIIIEIPEQLGLKVNIVERWGKNDVEKLFRRPNVVLGSNPKLFRK
jgi:hypothetical protein